MNKEIYALKCIECPYRLGMVSCDLSPCTECLNSKSVTPPLPELPPETK